jgi:7-keto-8-aminopelargonate synthetase-like enzyme
LVSLKDRYGAWLMLDEAHATGLYGAHRRGLAEEAGVSDRIEIQMGTLGKAMGASGGFIAGPKALINFLINQARSFIFSTAPVPAAAAAARAALAVVQSEEGKLLCERLWSVVLQTRRGLAEAGWTLPAGRSAITPLILGDEARALNAARALRELGMFIPAIRYPTVARGQARLRLTLTAAHTESQVSALLAALKESAPHA